MEDTKKIPKWALIAGGLMISALTCSFGSIIVGLASGAPKQGQTWKNRATGNTVQVRHVGVDAIRKQIWAGLPLEAGSPEDYVYYADKNSNAAFQTGWRKRDTWTSAMVDNMNAWNSEMEVDEFELKFEKVKKK